MVFKQPFKGLKNVSVQFGLIHGLIGRVPTAENISLFSASFLTSSQALGAD